MVKSQDVMNEPSLDDIKPDGVLKTNQGSQK